MYHLFRKTVTLKSGKQVKRWYYWYYDSNGKRKNRVCPNCGIKADAEAYYNMKISSSLTHNIVLEDWIEKWDGKLPYMQGNSNMVPMVNFNIKPFLFIKK